MLYLVMQMFEVISQIQHVTCPYLEGDCNEKYIPVDPGVTNRPIRCKLTARTDDPEYLANSQVIPDRRM